MTVHSKFTGMISVSLILSSEGAAKLFFSVAEGELYLSVKESFFSTISKGCCSGSSSGDASVDYMIQSQQVSQDCVLSVDDNVISAMSYRKSLRKVDGAELTSGTANESCWNCCMCCQWQCRCIGCCGCFECCGGPKSETVVFKDSGVMASAVEAPTTHAMNRGASESDRLAIALKLVPHASEEICVVVHYVNPLNLESKTCTMLLRNEGEDLNAVYNSARMFIGAIGQFRAQVTLDAVKKYPKGKFEGVKKDANPYNPFLSNKEYFVSEN